ncbi:MAG: non-canonical purine NTP pyrophosphatase [Candidatus Dojkabacteria bacterium]
MLYFISGNKNKFAEAKSVLPELEQMEVPDLPELQSLDSKVVIAAKLKAARDYVSENLPDFSGMIILEDTSLVIDSLNGLPGALIKHFVDTIGAEGIYKISHAMGKQQGEAKAALEAEFRCELGVLQVGGGNESNQNEHSQPQFYSASIKGEIVEPRGVHGFGFDPAFLPEGSNKTFGELSGEEKAKYNPRRIVFEELKNLGAYT